MEEGMLRDGGGDLVAVQNPLLHQCGYDSLHRTASPPDELKRFGGCVIQHDLDLGYKGGVGSEG